MPKRASSRSHRSVGSQRESAGAPVRSIWSGTITFGLVSIPVDLLSAVQPRHTGMKLVDKEGHALGRQYRCSKDQKKLDNDDLIRGYETDTGTMVPISDAEFESAAPEMSADIELRSFVPLQDIPTLYFQKPYFLAPAGKSAKAYHLLAATMESTGRVGIGSFVMRGHEYLVAIVSDHGVLRADTLRYADEIRTPEMIELPKVARATASRVNQFVKDIEALEQRSVDLRELEDRDAEALETLAKSKRKDEARVIHREDLEAADAGAAPGGNVIDLMAVLRKSLSKSTVVSTGAGAAPISMDAHRQRRAKQATSGSRRKRSARRKTAQR